MPYKDPEAQRAAHKRWYEISKARRQEQVREYKAKNAVRVAAQNAAYRARPEVLAAATARKQEWREVNRDRQRSTARSWAKRNRERITAYSRGRDRTEYNRAYYAANPERYRYHNAIRYIAKRDGVTEDQYALMVALGAPSL